MGVGIFSVSVSYRIEGMMKNDLIRITKQLRYNEIDWIPLQISLIDRRHTPENIQPLMVYSGFNGEF